MKRVLGALLLLVVCSLESLPANAQSITIPATLQVDTPGLVVIRASALDCDDARWYVLSSGLQTFPPDVIQPKLGVFLGLALQTGTYKIGVVPAKDVGGKAKIGEAQVCVVTVGTVPPPPPPPPSDPLAAAMQAAYATETDANKAAEAVVLAQLYSYGATAAANPANVTWGDLFADVGGKAAALGIGGKLPSVQNAVVQAALAVMPGSATTTVGMVAADRAQATAFFSKVALIAGALR